MGDQTQAYDIFQAPLSSGYPLPLKQILKARIFKFLRSPWMGMMKAHDPRNDFYKNPDKQLCLVCFFIFLLQALQHKNFYTVAQ